MPITHFSDKMQVRANFSQSLLVITAPKKSTPCNIKVQVTENDQAEEDKSFLNWASARSNKNQDQKESTVVIGPNKSVLPEKTVVQPMDRMATVSSCGSLTSNKMNRSSMQG